MPDPAPPPEAAGDEHEPSFEAALEQLDAVVADLEGGSLDLDAALARYERGIRLLARCRSSLSAAERRVALLTGLDDGGSPRTTTFDDPAALDDDDS